MVLVNNRAAQSNRNNRTVTIDLYTLYVTRTLISRYILPLSCLFQPPKILNITLCAELHIIEAINLEKRVASMCEDHFGNLQSIFLDACSSILTGAGGSHLRLIIDNFRYLDQGIFIMQKGAAYMGHR